MTGYLEDTHLSEKFVKEYGLSQAETVRQLLVATEAVSHMVR